MKRTPFIASALLVVTSLAACGDDSGYEEKRPRTGGPLRPTAGPVLETPPPTTGKPLLSPDMLAALAKTDVVGFKRTSERSSTTQASMTYEGTTPNAQGWHAQGMVTVEHCAFCAKMDLAAWRANADLKKLLAPAHLANPALVFQVDALDVGGRKAMAIYKESFVETTTSSGTSRSTAHGLQVWFNDGAHQVMIDVSPRGKSMAGSAEEMRAVMTRAEMEEAAKALFAAFAPVF